VRDYIAIKWRKSLLLLLLLLLIILGIEPRTLSLANALPLELHPPALLGCFAFDIESP
jgi:hypothetical protein